MKKLFVLLVVALSAGSAWAAVVITCDVNGNDITVNYDASGPELVRIFTLDIVVDSGATITAVSNINSDYYIYPGSVSVDPDTGGVTTYGSPIADCVVYPEGTLCGIGTGGMTIEMGSLYAASDPTHQDPPAASGSLLTFTVSGPCCVTITENSDRGGIVLEDPTVASSPVFPGQTECCVPAESCPCMGDMNSDGWLSPSDISNIVSRLIPYASNAYWRLALPGSPCADMNGDGWWSPSDISAVVGILLPHADNAYWVQCE